MRQGAQFEAGRGRKGAAPEASDEHASEFASELGFQAVHGRIGNPRVRKH